MDYLQKHLWKIFGLIVLGALVFWFCYKACGQQGAGASNLMNPPTALHVVIQSSAPVPKFTVQQYTNVWYLAAKDQDANGLTSDYSVECVITNIYSDTSAPQSIAVMAWSPPACTNVITNYTLWWGIATRSYSNSISAGTNLTATAQLIPPPPPPLTNYIITLICALTNLPPLVLTNPVSKVFRAEATNTSGHTWRTAYQGSVSPKGPWVYLNGPTATNQYKPSRTQLGVSVSVSWG